jgi:hypothetical protein
MTGDGSRRMPTQALNSRAETGQPSLEAFDFHNKRLERELRRLQRRTSIGYQISVKWLPGTPQYNNGKKLAEQVVGDTIFIYTENPDKAIELLRHGFAEWLLNRVSRPYRQLVNHLISLFEEMQYKRKEELIEALMKVL